MELKNKTAVIYGATGAIGRAVALAFAEEGCSLFLTGRNPNEMDKLVKEITKRGGKAEGDQLTAKGYTTPVLPYMRSHFITATAAARQMSSKKSGVIITLTAVPSKLAAPLVGGMAPSWAGIEALARTIAAEVGSLGIRAVCLRADGMPETDTITTVFGLHAKGAGMPSNKEFQSLMESFTILKRLPKLSELANTAVFIASDKASAITGTTINVTCGSVVD